MERQGIFGSVIKDNKGTKSKNGVEVETEDCRQSIEELSMIFSTVNLPTDNKTEAKIVMNKGDVDLDIGSILFSKLLSSLFLVYKLSQLISSAICCTFLIFHEVCVVHPLPILFVVS